MNVDLPLALLAKLDLAAGVREISRQSLIKTWLYEKIKAESRHPGNLTLLSPSRRYQRLSQLFVMDYPEYFRQLADYYNNSRITSKVMTGTAEIRADFNQEGSWVRHCAEHLQLTLAKRKVLEVACGGGRWTQFIADVADRVVATDPCPRLLEFGRKLGIPNTEWVECDAFSLDKIKETFSGACHVNFMNHVPLELLPTFIDRLHQARTGVYGFLGNPTISR